MANCEDCIYKTEGGECLIKMANREADTNCRPEIVEGVCKTKDEADDPKILETFENRLRRSQN